MKEHVILSFFLYSINETILYILYIQTILEMFDLTTNNKGLI